MNNVMNFEGHEVEVFEFNGQVLFNPYHVAKCLEIKNIRDNLAGMNEKQVIKLTNSKVGITDFRKLHNTGENFLTESGVYKLILKSRKPEAERFQNWVTDEVLPSIRKHGAYITPTQSNTKDEKIKIMEMNARTRMANTYLKMAKVYTASKEYKNILVALASEVLAGKEIIPLPKQEKKTYSAKEIGEIFGVSANKVGRLANEHNLKVAEYGEIYRSKSKSSVKEVDTWVYYDTVIPVFKQILN